MDSNPINSPMTLRRLRQNAAIRNLVKEIRLDTSAFIQPYFFSKNIKTPEAIEGLPTIFRDNQESLIRRIESDMEQGVRSGLLFPIPSHRSESLDFYLECISFLRTRLGSDFFIWSDLCVCSFTHEGHCGVIESDHVHNQKSVSLLTQRALLLAQAGIHGIAPSDMMDGRVGAIRSILDQAEHDAVCIMSYSAKFASQFYGPFRNAADSAPKLSGELSHRASYQLDPARRHDALLCAKRDLKEGADIIMVKPGLPYLDILHELSQSIECPLAAYEVSGEWSSLELMAANGLIDRRLGHLEAWNSLHRAGAQIIISYGARQVRQWL